MDHDRKREKDRDRRKQCSVNELLAELIEAVEDNAKWQASTATEIKDGFALVAAELKNLQPIPPAAQTRGTIMADYQIPDDQPDAGFSLAIIAKDSEGNPITDPAELAKLTVEIVNSDDTVFAATLDGSGRAGTYHVGNPGQATVTQNLKDADGNLIATGTDAFTVTTGKVALGGVSASFEGLTPIAPPA